MKSKDISGTKPITTVTKTPEAQEYEQNCPIENRFGIFILSRLRKKERYASGNHLT